MTSALIVYHSLFGNTKEVAFSLAHGIEESGVKADCLSIDEVDIDQIPNYDFLAIGGPTHQIGLSREMKIFLKKLKSVNLVGMKGFSFDTRKHSRLNKKRWLMLENSAARKIEGRMRKLQINIVRARQSAIVHGREGPLESDAEESFKKMGKEIGNMLASQVE
ncbi:MAG: flavodoxin family protein [Candidatus Hodarchaeota archaeon]